MNLTPLQWPRTYHLHIVQRTQHPDFKKQITDVLTEDAGCAVIHAQPEPAGHTRDGHAKWRKCIVQIRDSNCLFAMGDRLQKGSITHSFRGFP